MTDPVPFSRAAVTDERQAYYERIKGLSLAPLWEHLHALVPGSPTTPVVPWRWDYDNDVRPFVMESGELITAKEAERRVLMLENPGLAGKASITHSLYAGIQLVRPGEVAPLHRHSQSAMRFILEGDGSAYTSVGGEQIWMRPGDLVLTPSWNWHDHGNEGDKPIVWMDALDIPTVAFLDTGFAENGNAERQTVAKPKGDGYVRFGSNLAPVDWKPTTKSSPLFSYPYDRTREVLDAMRLADPADPCHGRKMRYVNPASGGHVTPTMGAFIQLLEAGEQTAPYRCTDGTVYCVVEGTGTSTFGDKTFHWKPRDILVAPSWAWQTHKADSEAVLFSFSDRPIHEVLGLWREERGQA